jgi:ABC-2 type transport system ATP-binding protein
LGGTKEGKTLMSAVLSMKDVGISFGDRKVLDGLSFSVEAGETFGFLGPSGAGKTTTIKLLTRQLTKNSGDIRILGTAVENLVSRDYERIGILSDTSALYDRLSIEDNLELYAKIRGVGRSRIPALLEDLGLARDRKTPIKNCSKGMKQRANLAAVLLHKPDLLFLDEPTSGLDPAARAKVHGLLDDLKGSTTVFLTTHDMAEAETQCDRLGILDAGSVRACDTPLNLKLRYARNRVVVRTRTRGLVQTTKDAVGSETICSLMKADECVSIHSDEPNLEEVFLQLTGKELT